MINKIENRQDLEELFRWLNEPLYKYIYVRCGYNRELAQDITQDVFLKVWDKRETFNPKKSTLKNWVYIIARNHIVDLYRKKKINLKTLDEDIQGSVKDHSLDTENELMMCQVLKNLNRLKEGDKEVIVLRYIEDLEIAEVAQIIGKSENTTKVMIHRAVKRLKFLVNK